MFERYTEKARRAIFFARYEASQFGSPYIEAEHLLLGIMRENIAIAGHLSRPHFTAEHIRKRIGELRPSRAKVSTSVDMPLSEESKRALAHAAEEADRLGDKQISTRHLLLGLLREENGIVAKVLSEAGISASEFRQEVAQLSDVSGKIGLFPSVKPEDPVAIHGELWNAKSVWVLGKYYGRFDWEKRRWQPRDALVRRSNHKLRSYTGEPYDPEQFDLVKGAWTEDRCAICSWKLCESDAIDCQEGYTNGQDWLCTECFDKFIRPGRPDAEDADARPS